MTKLENPEDNEKTIKASIKVHNHHILTNNNVTVSRGEVGGHNGGNGGRVFKNNYKGHMDKNKGGMEAREEGVHGWGGEGEVGGKCRQL